jgi:hypothetical protein
MSISFIRRSRNRVDTIIHLPQNSTTPEGISKPKPGQTKKLANQNHAKSLSLQLSTRKKLSPLWEITFFPSRSIRSAESLKIKLGARLR